MYLQKTNHQKKLEDPEKNDFLILQKVENSDLIYSRLDHMKISRLNNYHPAFFWLLKLLMKYQAFQNKSKKKEKNTNFLIAQTMYQH